MSKPIDKGWVALTITKIISAAVAVLAVVLFIGAINLFYQSNQYVAESQAHPNVAEDQPHGLDALAAIFAGGFGLLLLVVSVVLFAIALPTFITTNRKLQKKAAVVNQQPKNQAIALDTQQTTTSPQAPQNGTVSDITDHETPDNGQQRGV